MLSCTTGATTNTTVKGARNVFRRKLGLDEIHTYVEDITELQTQRDNAPSIEERERGSNLVEQVQRVLERLLEQL